MKKTHFLSGLSACACVMASGSVSAQSTVSIYGVIDASVEHVTKASPSGGGLTRVPALTGSAPSRLGFRGTEDLGQGLKTVFTLETGFSPDTGVANQGGRAFGRQAFVGLSGPWGTVSLGRQYTMLFYSILESDILGPNLYSSGSLDSYIPNARADNAISYRGSFSGLTLGASYSLGRDAVNAGPSPAGTHCAGENPNDSKACREWSALVKYDTATWGTALAVDEIRGGAGAFAGLSSSAMTDRRTSANGYVKLGGLKLAGGLIRRANGASATNGKSDLWYLGAAYNLTPALLVDGEVFSLRYKDSVNRATLAAVRATYSFSRRTAVYATAGHIQNKGTLALSVSGGQPGGAPVPGGSQSGVAFGVRHSF